MHHTNKTPRKLQTDHGQGQTNTSTTVQQEHKECYQDWFSLRKLSSLIRTRISGHQGESYSAHLQKAGHIFSRLYMEEATQGTGESSNQMELGWRPKLQQQPRSNELQGQPGLSENQSDSLSLNKTITVYNKI